jgi:hypothetical protein
MNSFATRGFLDSDMDSDPFDFGNGSRHFEDLAVGNLAVGLEDHLASSFPDPVGDGFADLVERHSGSFAVPQQESQFSSLDCGLEERQERGLRLLDAHSMPGGRNIDLLATGHLHGKEHERHELKNDIHHGGHIDVLITFLRCFAAE